MRSHWGIRWGVVSVFDCVLLFFLSYAYACERTAGARQVATGLSIAKDTGAKLFVTSMCIGSGMGMAALFVSEQ